MKYSNIVFDIDNTLIDSNEEVTLFDGVRQVIQELKSKGINLGIVTSKTREEYENVFVRFGLDSYFDVVICADDTNNHKSNEESLKKYLEIVNGSKEETIYIGGPINNMQCAKNAGVDSALALWGRGD